jgi:hypothetical protein
MSSFADEVEYKLDAVEATQLAANEIDKAFRPACIGSCLRHINLVLFQVFHFRIC